MTYKWTQKQVIDECLQDYWDVATNTTSLNKIIGWINEIQDDLAKEIRMPWFKITMKKLLPTQQQVVNLAPEIPGQSTAVISSGGSLTDGTSYKVYVTFLMWNDDTKNYIESEPSVASDICTGDASNKTISISAIPTYSGDTSVSPSTIWRRIYVSKTDSNGDYGAPLYDQDIEDNTTTTATVTSETSSTITPPSDSEIDEITDDGMTWATGSGYLRQNQKAKIRRFSPDTTQVSTTPYFFDFEGHESIFLWPSLSSSSSTAQRTLIYSVYRRPHEVFYEATRSMDMPIAFKRALKSGVMWLGYNHRDRAGKESKEINYEKEKAKLVRKYGRNFGMPESVTDVNGDTYGYMVE